MNSLFIDSLNLIYVHIEKMDWWMHIHNANMHCIVRMMKSKQHAHFLIQLLQQKHLIA